MTCSVKKKRTLGRYSNLCNNLYIKVSLSLKFKGRTVNYNFTVLYYSIYDLLVACIKV